MAAVSCTLMKSQLRYIKNGPQWKFAGAFYYALVVLTLIGYGHSTANTTIGKLTTIIYAGIGIPMALVMFQSMGERMNKFFSVIVRKVRGWLGCARVDANEIDLIIASGTTSFMLISSGATLYHYMENWSLFDSFYYSFITLSTIGFGDFVALQEGNSLTVSFYTSKYLQYVYLANNAAFENKEQTEKYSL